MNHDRDDEFWGSAQSSGSTIRRDDDFVVAKDEGDMQMGTRRKDVDQFQRELARNPKLAEVLEKFHAAVRELDEALDGRLEGVAVKIRSDG